MKLFFGEILNDRVIIDADEQHHISKVLRMKEGEEIYVTDGKSNVAKGNLVLEGKKVELDILEIQTKTPPFSPYLHIAIAPTKNIDRIEFFVEKATEMGISEISFLLTEKSERKHINIDKIQKKVIAASKQSLRYHFPKVNDLQKFTNFMQTQSAENTFVAHCDKAFKRVSLSEIPLVDKVCFLIGPEGDFSPSEIKLLLEKGVQAISLGNQRLRTETAGIFVAAWNYHKML
ncbi:RsmE family RNA methyltransferase [Riemerella anatipestifer]|uniref:RsmE family RNA methyltransferase n=1 Tax=Riemerella anatipestifer TaxID=34085 RepID=UPI002A8B936F|nr:RsmE family RNA methyltransferase [Riemerella anatipestifer]